MRKQEKSAGLKGRTYVFDVVMEAPDRFTRAVTWTISTDDALRTFLTEAGWAPDGAHRELDLDGTGSTRVKQVRLHTALS